MTMTITTTDTCPNCEDSERTYRTALGHGRAGRAFSAWHRCAARGHATRIPIEYLEDEGYIVERNQNGRAVRVAGPLHRSEYLDGVNDIILREDEQREYLDGIDDQDGAREDAKWFESETAALR